MKNILVILGLAGILSAGCVSQSRYDSLREYKDADITKLQKELTDSQNKLEESETIIAQLEQKLGTATTDKESMTKSVEQMKEALKELSSRKRETEKRIAEYQDLISRFKSFADAGQLKIKMVDGRMVVVLPSDVLFASGSTKLSTEGEKTLQEVGKLLSSIPEKSYQIEGHTDNVPIKTSNFPSNWELAAGRALTVTKVMLNAGLTQERLSAASYGENRPIADNNTDEGKTANRRIEIVIVPDLSTLPGYEELNKFSENRQTAKN